MPGKVDQRLGPQRVSSHLVLRAHWRRQLAGAGPPWPASPPPQGQSPKIGKGSSVNIERDTAISVTNKITRLPTAGHTLGLRLGSRSQRAQLSRLVSQSHKQSVRQKNDVTSPGIDQPPVWPCLLWLSPMVSDQRAQLITVTSKIVQKPLPFLVAVNICCVL